MGVVVNEVVLMMVRVVFIIRQFGDAGEGGVGAGGGMVVGGGEGWWWRLINTLGVVSGRAWVLGKLQCQLLFVLDLMVLKCNYIYRRFPGFKFECSSTCNMHIGVGGGQSLVVVVEGGHGGSGGGRMWRVGGWESVGACGCKSVRRVVDKNMRTQ